ncbi:MAG: amidohydrolase family protein [Candidatus Binatus sp.]|jgi:N-acyl-D-amino-acid deacylase
MALDVLIKNGTVVDGTGAPGKRADIAIAGDRIVEIGKVSESAKKVIDASDLIVSPGFVDPHTHYDAQICWDPTIGCSSWHGVTSVVMGNCGVGIAPCRPEAREIAAWDLVNVEAIPFDALSKGITWDWTTFPEFMNAAEKRGSSINLGFLAPLTPFRHFVMGQESMERAASADETKKIAALLSDAVSAGALGFSTTTLNQHIGYHGAPLACRLASNGELAAYANVLKRHSVGAIEVALTKKPLEVSDEEYALIDMLLTESGRPVTWLGIASSAGSPNKCFATLERCEPLFRRGAIPQTLCEPFVGQVDVKNPFIFADMKTWGRAFNQPVEVQKKIYADPQFREAFRNEFKSPHLFDFIRWKGMQVLEVGNPALKRYERKSIVEIAADRRTDEVDAFLDLALQDELGIQFATHMFHEEGVRKLLNDKRAMIGLSDGGAHVDMLCNAGYTSFLLGFWVREKQAIELETAIKRITSEPADFFGIKDRGRIGVGRKADINVFDLNTIDSARQTKMVNDLPGGGRRLVVGGKGIEYTLVNGEVLYEGGKHSGAMPGNVIRSAAA